MRTIPKLFWGQILLIAFLTGCAGSTADIAQALVMGAQAARKVTVVIK